MHRAVIKQRFNRPLTDCMRGMRFLASLVQGNMLPAFKLTLQFTSGTLITICKPMVPKLSWSASAACAAGSSKPFS